MYQPHEYRVIREEVDLSVKIDKLSDFATNDTFFTLPKEDRAIMFRQLNAMRDYQAALLERISRFTPEDMA